MDTSDCFSTTKGYNFSQTLNSYRTDKNLETSRPVSRTTDRTTAEPTAPSKKAATNVGKPSVTRMGRAVKPSRKAKDIALAETEGIECSQKTTGRKKISSKKARVARTFNLEPEQ